MSCEPGDGPTIFDVIRAGDVNAMIRMMDKDRAVAGSVNEAGVSAVLWALYHRRQDCVDLLLTADPPLNVFDAAAVGDLQLVKSLLDDMPGAIAAHAPDGFTPLHLAVFFGRGRVVEFLIDRGADINAVAENDMRVRPLHSAAAAGDAGIASMLLRAGADANVQQDGGWTPLHSAAMHGNHALVDVLLDRGADPSTRADDGRTPADMARGKGHAGIAKRLADLAP